MLHLPGSINSQCLSSNEEILSMRWRKMESEIKKSGNIDVRYIHWVRKTIRPFGPVLSDNTGRQFTLRRQIDAIFLLTDDEFKVALRILDRTQIAISGSIESNLEITEMASLISSVVEEPIKGSTLESFRAFWFPPIPNESFIALKPLLNELPKIVKDTFSSGKSYIFLSPEAIRNLSTRIAPRIHELKGRDIFQSVFKIVLIHEIGHHYAFGNISREDYIRIVWDHDGKFISEGLANWFAYQFCSKSERWILAEMALVQPLQYRYYHVLRFLDTAGILGRLLEESAPSIGKLGGKIFFKVPLCANRINGFQNMMDWDGNGAKILAIEYIDAIGPMMKGCLISPKIGRLIGRFPEDFLIVTNAINQILDYERLPPNILLIPKEKKDIEAIAEHNKEKVGDEYVKSVLEEIGINQNWIWKIFPPDLTKHL